MFQKTYDMFCISNTQLNPINVYSIYSKINHPSSLQGLIFNQPDEAQQRPGDLFP